MSILIEIFFVSIGFVRSVAQKEDKRCERRLCHDQQYLWKSQCPETASRLAFEPMQL